MNQPPFSGYGSGYGAGNPGQSYQGQGQGQWSGAQPGMGWQTPGIGQTSPWNRVVKGALIGAAATYLLTNEQVQRTAIKGAVRLWSLLQGGIEEVKERFGDAEAELRHANQQRDP